MIRRTSRHFTYPISHTIYPAETNTPIHVTTTVTVAEHTINNPATGATSTNTHYTVHETRDTDDNLVHLTPDQRDEAEALAAIHHDDLIDKETP